MNHAELRAAAEAATPGPWDYDAGTRGIEGQAYSLTYPMAEITGWVPKENALYIALASPDVVLGLLDELARLRAALEDIASGRYARPIDIAAAALATPPDATHDQVIE